MNQEQEKPLFEVGKTYSDGYGREIKILVNDVDVSSNYPIIGKVAGHTKSLVLLSYSEDGTALKADSNDRLNLITPKEPIEIKPRTLYEDVNGNILFISESREAVLAMTPEVKYGNGFFYVL
jgi:hypothetical protein